jgi:hypothetical protein
MCFSAEASARSFLAGMVGSILCVSLGTPTDKIVGFAIAFVSLMQGIEYLLWNHQKCDQWNRFLSVCGMTLNHLQPFVIGLIILWINPQTGYRNPILALMILYLAIIIPYSYNFIATRGACTLKGKDHGNLIWKWNALPYSRFVYFAFLVIMACLFVLGMPSRLVGIIAAVCSVAIFSTSLILYPREVAGALWCYYTAFIPIVYYILRLTIPNIIQ